MAEKLVGEGFLSYDDLSVIEPDALMEMGDLTAEQVDAIVLQAEVKAKEAEAAAADERRRQREQERIEAATAEADALEAAARGCRRIAADCASRLGERCQAASAGSAAADDHAAAATMLRPATMAAARTRNRPDA